MIRSGAHLAREYSLRAYDAVHCASALALKDPTLVAAAGDRSLLAAWRALGIDTVDINRTDDPT